MADVLGTDAAGPDQTRPVQPVRDPLPRGRLQDVPQRTVAQQRAGTQQALDDGQRSDDVTVDDAQVLVHYEQDGTAKTAVLPVAKLGLDLLANLHTGGCAQQQLDAAAAFSYRTPFHRETVDGDLVLVGDLVLKRPADGGSDEKVVVESVFGSVLFQFEATDAPNVLAPGQPSTKVPVLIRGNNRCDPHARSASQQTFVFTVDVRVGSSAEHREIIEPPTPLRVQAMAYLDDVC